MTAATVPGRDVAVHALLLVSTVTMMNRYAARNAVGTVFGTDVHLTHGTGTQFGETTEIRFDATEAVAALLALNVAAAATGAADTRVVRR